MRKSRFTTYSSGTFPWETQLFITSMGYGTDNKVLDWLTNNIGQRNLHWILRYYSEGITFNFKTTYDLTLFNLRWL